MTLATPHLHPFSYAQGKAMVASTEGGISRSGSVRGMDICAQPQDRTLCEVQ